jgi:hypothetical protein
VSGVLAAMLFGSEAGALTPQSDYADGAISTVTDYSLGARYATAKLNFHADGSIDIYGDGVVAGTLPARWYNGGPPPDKYHMRVTRQTNTWAGDGSTVPSYTGDIAITQMNLGTIQVTVEVYTGTWTSTTYAQASYFWEISDSASFTNILRTLTFTLTSQIVA